MKFHLRDHARANLWFVWAAKCDAAHSSAVGETTIRSAMMVCLPQRRQTREKRQSTRRRLGHPHAVFDESKIQTGISD